MLPDRLQATLNEKCYNITSEKILCTSALQLLGQYCTCQNTIQCCLKAIDNIRFRFNVVLIPLKQHCTGKNPRQCCWRDPKQLWVRENSVLFCINTLGTTLVKSNPIQCSSRQNYIYLQSCLNTIEKTLHRSKSRQHCIRKSSV